MISLLAESWTWYAVAVAVLIARYISRWIQLGSIKKFQADDFVMLFVFCFYTVLVSCMNIVAHVDTNLLLPEEIPLLTPQSIKARTYGSKMVLVVEQSMITVTWGCKVCLLLMYYKMTHGLKQQLIVKCLAGYVAFAWTLMEILYFGVWCRPFSEYWAVPTDNVQCSTAIHHLITNAVFNISSDLLMLCIPLPLLLKSQLPAFKKAILCGLFSMGIFVIICAILNKYYSFAHPFSPMWTFWYIREASTAVMVANMPMCWALMRRVFSLRSFLSTSSTHPSGHQLSANIINGSRKQQPVTSKKQRAQSVASSSRNGDAIWWERDGRRTSSSEELVPPGKTKAFPLEIWESKDFAVVDDGRLSSLPDEERAIAMYNGLGNKSPTVTTTVTAQHSETLDRLNGK